MWPDGTEDSKTHLPQTPIYLAEHIEHIQNLFSLRRRHSKPSVYSVCELVHNIVFESRSVARTYVGVLIG